MEDFRTFCTVAFDAILPKVIIASGEWNVLYVFFSLVQKNSTCGTRFFVVFVVVCQNLSTLTWLWFLLFTGDLTDAKDNILGSQQYEEEWRAYQSTLIDTGVINETVWLDIRGNHDNFNVQHLYDGKSDLFQNFSIQGPKHKQSYLHQEEVDGVKYNFLALDASAEPGTKRPYNFIGMIPADELKRVDKLLHDSPANYTIWFAHYPTSTIMTPKSSDHIRKFIGKYDETSMFLAGHLHTLGGLSNRMYTLQPEGFLELELGDFMKSRRYRIGVFDHGLFSFADVKLGTWPVAIITNPKNILFNNPFKEDMNMQLHSTHIRIVAFSTSEISTCKVRINDGLWMICVKKSENFFAVPWNPLNYNHGKHEMELLVGDADGRIFHKIQTFALDGSRNQFDLMARFILMSDVTTVFQFGFVCAFVLCLVPLVWFKTWQLLIVTQKIRRPKIASPFWRSFVQRYLIFASIDRVFFVVAFWLFYTAIGPWSFHEVLDGHVGYFFVWGIFVKGEFIPGTLNWWYGFHQLMFFQLPLMLCIAGVVHRRFQKFLVKHENPTMHSEDTVMQALYKNLPFLALLTVELLLAAFYLIQNGIFAFIIAPIRVWGILMTIYLFYQAHWKITDQHFQQSAVMSLILAKQATS